MTDNIDSIQSLHQRIQTAYWMPSWTHYADTVRCY